ncbi:GntR family transcriptional regulator [Desertivirga brevis]|uniref:GntR family transcriptional regulator n=1 Tax=Desertivirga brevis TaxID=2810310 RepID=UPI001A96D65E|nr:GntR family transcriptional regulator [Pedobacter sp. SYSU D00873]
MSLVTIEIDQNSKVSKVEQVAQAIVHHIEKGALKKGERLLSISEFSKQYKISRDTVEKAYKLLKDEGYIETVPGRGNYIADKKDNKLKVLLLFNKLSSYKKNVYYSLVEALGKKAKVDLQIYHYDADLFREIVEASLGKYHYYVVMPYFLKKGKEVDGLELVRLIPEDELILLDKNLPQLGEAHSVIYQDFKRDIYEALESDLESLEKYDDIIVIFPPDKNYQRDISLGIKAFCKDHDKGFLEVENLSKVNPGRNELYITLAESDLADLINKVKQTSLVIGEDVGIISFNDTILKGLLNISVVTTDFENMGGAAANLILKKQKQQIRNPFHLIKRGSL